jgi:hypothetical protein
MKKYLVITVVKSVMRYSLWDSPLTMSRYKTKLFRKWENGASEMNKELIRLYPREMPEPLHFKRERVPFLRVSWYATCWTGVWYNSACRSHTEGPNHKTWNKYWSGLIDGKRSSVFSREKGSQSSPNVSLTQFYLTLDLLLSLTFIQSLLFV